MEQIDEPLAPGIELTGSFADQCLSANISGVNYTSYWLDGDLDLDFLQGSAL